MISSIVNLITETLTQLTAGLAELPITMFNILVWDADTGNLTDFAIYALVFSFAGIILTLVVKLFKIV